MAALGVLVGIQALREPPPGSVTVVVAATDLDAGHALTAADLIVRPWPIAFPAGNAFVDPQDAVGRFTAGPLAAGEPVGPTRIVGPSLLRMGQLQNGQPNSGDQSELVAAPIRLADADEAKLLRPGDVVDVLAARGGGVGDSDNSTANATSSESARIVASGARVIVVPNNRSDYGGGVLGDGGDTNDGPLGAGSLLVLAVDRQTAAALAGAATRSRLSVVLRSQEPPSN